MSNLDDLIAEARREINAFERTSAKTGIALADALDALLPAVRDIVKRGDWYDKRVGNLGWCGHCGKAYVKVDEEWKPEHFDECPLYQLSRVLDAPAGGEREGGGTGT